METKVKHTAIPRSFLGIAVLVIVTLSISSHLRNRAWQTSESLWQDVCEKTYARRIIDPTTNTEVPRAKRGRIYNNIGLGLFSRGLRILAIRDKMGTLLARQRQTGAGAGAKETAEHTALAEELERLEISLISYIPEEFIEICKRSWVRQPWDPLLPAELCYRKALYHLPTYPTACLNVGLLHKRRADRMSPDSGERDRELQKAEIFYTAAHTIDEAYEKALWYHAVVTFQRRNYPETLRLLALAEKLNDPSVGLSGKWSQFELGVRAALLTKDYSTAQRFVSRYIALKPPSERSGPALATFADILARQGQLKASLILLREAIKAVPRQEEFLRQRVITRLVYAGRLTEAYEQAILTATRFPDKHTALTEAGRFALKMGRYTEAATWLDRALRLAPHSKTATFLRRAAIYNRTITRATEMHLPWLWLPEIVEEKIGEQ